MVVLCFVRLRILLAILGVGGAVLMYRRGGRGQRVELREVADPLVEQAEGWALAEAPCTVGLPIVPVPADAPRRPKRLTLLSGGRPVAEAASATPAGAQSTERKPGVRGAWAIVASEKLEDRTLKAAASRWRLEF